jgi:PmbA protein
MSIIEQVLNYATQAGADAADAMVANSVDLSVACRMGQQEELERSESSGVGLRVWVGQRSASVSTSDMRDASLKQMAQRAVDMARVATEDPYATLAPESLLARNFPELQLADTHEPDAPTLQRMALQAEDTARAVQGITNSEGADCSYGKSFVELATSHGFYGSYTDTSFSFSVSVLVGTGEGMERDYDYAVARFMADLPTPESIGQSAAEKALKRLNPRKKNTCQVPVVYDPRVSRSLIGAFAGAINGSSIARGTSFLKDAMGTAVFPKGITIVDDPHRMRGLASQPFDAEGVACSKRVMVADGVLESWFLDCRSAAKLGLTTTGHAARGLGGNPSPSSTNLYMEAGKDSPEALIAEIKDGFYVTETFGMGVNLITGDYSQGASGFWIEKGKIAYPVSELTVAGKMRDMFANITPANDVVFRYGTNAPTIRVDGMTVAGT